VLLQVQFESYQSLNQKLAAVNLEWNTFANGGESAKRTGELEGIISHLKREMSSLAEQWHQQVSDYNHRKAACETKLKQLSKEETDSDAAEKLTEELSNVRTILTETTNALGDQLSADDPEILRELWEEMLRYRTELREIRDKLSAHQSLDEIRARQSLLVEEFEEVKDKLCLIDPLYLLNGTVAEYAAKYSSQMQQISEELDQNNAYENELKDELKRIDIETLTQAAAQTESLERLTAQMDECKERLAALEREVATTQELISSVQAELKELDRTFLGDLEETMNKFLYSISDGKFKCLQFDEVLLAESADGTTRPLNLLSGGMKDMIWLVIRLAMLDSVKQADDFPIIWDEAFTRLDQIYLQRLKALIELSARNRQVILLSKDPGIESWGQTARIPKSIVIAEEVK
jgi:DNA repair exonuclease SbcCD ATPase subunit